VALNGRETAAIPRQRTHDVAGHAAVHELTEAGRALVSPSGHGLLRWSPCSLSSCRGLAGPGDGDCPQLLDQAAAVVGPGRQDNLARFDPGDGNGGQVGAKRR
jgi:hypothetical protein